MHYIFAVLVAFELKKYLCSYVFQTPYMLRRVRGDHTLLPSLAYALIHSMATLAIAVAYCTRDGDYAGEILFIDLPFAAAILDFIFQFTIDWVYLRNKFFKTFQPLTIDGFSGASEETAKLNWRFWSTLGLKNMTHHISCYIVIFVLWRFGG